MKYITIITSILILLGCSVEKNYKTIVSEMLYDSVYLPSVSNEYKEAYKSQAVLFKNRETIINLTYKYGNFNNELYFIDVKTKQNVNTLSIENKLSFNFALDYFEYINEDSILLYYKNYESTDSSIILVDYKSNIKKIYNMNSPYISNRNHNYRNDSTLDIDFWFGMVKRFKNKIFFQLYLSYPYDGDYGTSKFVNKKYPIIAYLDIVKDTIIVNENIWYPNLKEGCYYPDQSKKIYFCFSGNGNPIIGFANTSTLLEWEVETGKIIKHQNFKSQLIDTILPEKEPYNVQYSNSEPYYSGIYYQKETDSYVRYINFPKGKYGNFKNIEIYADKNLNYTGESYNTNYIRDCIDGLNNSLSVWRFHHNTNSWHYTEYPDSIKLVKIKYEFGKLDIAKIKTAMETEKQKVLNKENEAFCKIMGNDYKFEGYTHELMINYAKNMFNIKDSSTFSLFVINDGGCGSCNDFVLKFISTNKLAMEEISTYLLFSGNTSNYYKSKIKEYNLGDYSKLRLDTTIVYKKMHPFFELNPRLVLVKNNKIVSDTIYMPQDLNNIMLDYIDFYKLDTEK